MAIPKFEDDLRIISKLGDNPGTDNGYTTQEFKEAFDKAPLLIQKFINEVLIPAANASSSPEEGLSMKGPINMNGQKLSGIGVPTADDEAANMGFVNQQMKKAAHLNLLDNSDFRNPVNQRGQTSYTAVGYTIDRWLKNTGTIITVDENGLNFVVNTAGNSAAFYQKIANANKFLGKKLTFVVYTDKGNILSVVEIPSTYPSGASYYGTVRTKYGYIQLMILSSTENQIYAIFSPSVNCTLYRAALYEGEYNAETLPEYHPKGFGAELVECRRYFKKPSQVYRSATSSDVAPGVNFEISMRIAPTVKIFDCDMNEGYVSVWTNDGVSKVAVNRAPAFADGIFYIDAPVPAGCMVGYSYEASADL